MSKKVLGVCVGQASWVCAMHSWVCVSHTLPPAWHTLPWPCPTHSRDLFFHCERVKTAFLKVSKIWFLENRKVPISLFFLYQYCFLYSVYVFTLKRMYVSWFQFIKSELIVRYKFIRIQLLCFCSKLRINYHLINLDLLIYFKLKTDLMQLKTVFIF